MFLFGRQLESWAKQENRKTRWPAKINQSSGRRGRLQKTQLRIKD